MAENKKSFVAYADWKNTFQMLTDEEAGKLVKHLLSYVNDENPELNDRFLKMAFEPIKLQLKRDLHKYETVKEKRSKAGIKSAEIRKQNATNSTSVESVQHTATNSTVNDTVTVNVNDTVTDTVTDILLEKETKEEFKKISISKNEIFGKEVLESESWIETISMQNRITPEEIPKWIDDFNKKLITEIDTKISKKEYASHFSRWLPGEISKTKKTATNGKLQTGSRNR